jgi:hypothetical protein
MALATLARSCPSPQYFGLSDATAKAIVKAVSEAIAG